ncbi:MAG: ImmA/IrrE family metallo-endopeptidase [Alphaproteobacteria bacterium]|jgi:HTH-type transcriptional regulator / antitoxin HigA|nr:ImmA/IrrE family metallo-endopeptidase [Alphaproteobacteria bacterium]MBT7943966.1 ImmA/IrrE family metallo-endopeptidase [Alphaproteobacteria bacterium]
MSASSHLFQPDYAISPGEILEDEIRARGIKKVDLANRCGRPIKTISEIISGKTGITPETAIQFERVLGIPAHVWTNLESNFRLRLAKKSDDETLVDFIEWALVFPINKMVEQGFIAKPKDKVDSVRKLLDFLGVASPLAYEKFLLENKVAFRRSPSFESSPQAVAAWLRQGELIGQDIDCQPYDERIFKEALKKIRLLTMKDPDIFVAEMTTVLSSAGVAIAFVPELPKTHLSGAARWLSKDKALIQLSLRHKSDDFLWFTFFHEAAHILLHGKKEVFIDDTKTRDDELENEANSFSENILIPKKEWVDFVARHTFSKVAVKSFAKLQRIAPGIVVGRLQKYSLLPYKSNLNHLKRRFEWTSE